MLPKIKRAKRIAIYVAGLSVILSIARLCLFKRSTISPTERPSHVPKLQEIWKKGEPYSPIHIFMALVYTDRDNLTPEQYEQFVYDKRKVLEQIDQVIRMYEKGKTPKTTLTLERLRELREKVARLDRPIWLLPDGELDPEVRQW